METRESELLEKDFKEDQERESLPQDASNPNNAESGENMSKNQRKRLKRREMFEQIKESKRQKKLLETKEFQDLDVKVAANVKNVETEVGDLSRNERQERKKNRDLEMIENAKNNFHIIIDCSWENDHTESNLKSLTQQIMFCYGCNKRHEKPAFLHLTNLGPKTSSQLEKNHLSSWIAVETSSEDYIYNPLFSIDKTQGKKQLVYLTSDGDEVLDSLHSDEAYIIGGIVDRNRLKGITYEKAKSQGIRTARLPIKDWMKLTATHILTVNHVFDILMTYQLTQNWKDTLEKVIPKRKEKPHPSSSVTTSHEEPKEDSNSSDKFEIEA